MRVLYLNSDQTGQGDTTLGRKLMATFLEKLLDSSALIDAVVCVNSGVRLTTEDCDARGFLEVLEDRGAGISSCATCLDHYGLRDRLAVGRVGTMPETVRLLTTADEVIQP